MIGGREPSGPRHRVLVVEDTPELRELVVTALVRDGFEVESSDDGERAVEHARRFAPDVIVLDLGLPVIDGMEVCRRVRTFSDAYVVMLTGRDDELDKVVGLSVGADDYITKPFSVRELVARIRAMLRRPRRAEPAAGGDVRRFGDLEIDVASREVRVGDEEVELTRIEFDLLQALSSSPRTVFRRSRLMEIVWGPEWYGDDHVVDVHVSKLRQKLHDDPKSPRYVRTVRGVGFRFDAGT